MSNMDSDMIIINVVAKKSSKTIELSVPDDVFNQAERILLKNERGVFCKTFPAEAFSSDSWISVKDELPKIPENKFCADVLAYCNDGTGIVKAYYEVDGVWNYDDYYDVKCVTHWMPLPDDPQEVDND